MNILYGLILAFLSGLLITNDSPLSDLIMSMFCIGIAIVVAFWRENEDEGIDRR